MHRDYIGTAADVRAKYAEDMKQRRARRRPERPRGARRGGRAGTNGSELSLSGLLEGFPEDQTVDDVPPVDGTARSMSVAAGGQVVLEFWGNPERLGRATALVKIVDISDAELERNARLALRFVENAMPALDRDVSWMVDRLRHISSGDAGEGKLEAGERVVAFEFNKPLGSVLISVERR